jgi:hypothetical protein
VTAPADLPPPQTPQDASTAAMMAAYLAATAALRSRLLGMIAAGFAAQRDYRDAAAEAFVAMAVPAVGAAQQTMAALTSAYIAHLVAEAAGGSTAPIGVPLEALSNLRGIDPTEVYRRPYVQVWTDLSKGKSFDDSVDAGARRAASLAATDLQLAKTRAAQVVMADDRRVVGYRRVLVGSHSCGMCVIASSVRYHKSNLMPIHPGCDCAIAPILGYGDPGRTIDSAVLKEDASQLDIGSQGMKFFSHNDVIEVGDLLEPAHRAVEDSFGSRATDARAIDYRKVIMVRQHGEIGPVLTVADHKFTKKQISLGNLRAKAGTYATQKGREITNIGEQ